MLLTGVAFVAQGAVQQTGGPGIYEAVAGSFGFRYVRSPMPGVIVIELAESPQVFPYQWANLVAISTTPAPASLRIIVDGAFGGTTGNEIMIAAMAPDGITPEPATLAFVFAISRTAPTL